jgi:hypothetical protein
MYTLPLLTMMFSDEISKLLHAGTGSGKTGREVMVTGREPSSVPGLPPGPSSAKTTISIACDLGPPHSVLNARHTDV